jgi:3-oxoacyl-[acyl-carrier protein] reductase
MKMEKMLDGKVCIVTGGGRGIAKEACLLFSREGGKVVVCDLDETPALETVGEIKKMGGKAVAVSGDVTAEGVPEKIIATAISTFGGIDVIVNAAGYTWDSMIQNMTDSQFDAMINVHLKAPFRILRAAANFIREKSKEEQGTGKMVMRKVINISSLAGTGGNPGQANYSSAKAGLIGLTKTMSKEWGRYKVNVNCIPYGVIETRLTQEKEKGEFIERDGQKIAVGIPKAGKSAWGTMIPLGRSGTVQEAAGAILFFASPLSDYVSGQVLCVAGGLNA